MADTRTRKYWGWGYEGAGPDAAQTEAIAAMLAARFEVDVPPPRQVRPVEALDLPAPRITPPAPLAELCGTTPYDRASHTYGKAFRDIVRAVDGTFPHPPDVVARPATPAEVAAVLDWCADAGCAAIPYGGGSSVVGGVEARPDDAASEAYKGVVSVDLGRLDAVLDIDRTSRAVHAQAGVLGPALEGALRPEALTLRHFPQSFELSTLGGWIATRSGGHYATRVTHIEDFVEGIEVVAPAGTLTTRRLPGSGAGPSPDRLLAGSEGALGVITAAWMRLQDRPVHKASVAVTFPDFTSGAAAARAVVQAGLFPANCRVLDPIEALTAGAGDGGAAVLLLGCESAHHPVEADLRLALTCALDAGGSAGPMTVTSPDDTTPAGRAGAEGAWRGAFLQAPYLRDTLVLLGMVTETFETAITWDRFDRFHAAVMEAATTAVERVCGGGQVSARLTHVYPDGAAPYYTVIAPSRPGAQLAHWDEIKAAVSDVLLTEGGTITHHHAVGRDHRPWYERQRPALIGDALAAAKAAFDPSGILNPGVLLPARGPVA